MELILALHKDIDELLLRFSEKNSLRYRCFCEAFNVMNFTLIFSGKPKKILLQFTELAMEYLVSLLAQDHYSIQHRVGALYTLYALHHFQPCHPKAKARLTISSLDSLKRLIVELRAYNHFDALYVLACLQSQQGFCVCALPAPIEFGSWVSKAKAQIALIENQQVSEHKFHEYTRDIVGGSEKIHTCELLEKEYEELKQSHTDLLGPDFYNISSASPNTLTSLLKSRTEQFLSAIRGSVSSTKPSPTLLYPESSSPLDLDFNI